MTILYRDSQLGKYLVRDCVTRGEVEHWSPCVEYETREGAETNALHLNHECGGFGRCSLCRAEKERKAKRGR